MKLGGNVGTLAKQTGSYIIPFACSTNRCKFINSWDQFMVNLPFGKGIAIFGKPMFIKSATSKEEVKEQEALLEKELIRISQLADTKMGHEPMVPSLEPKKKKRVRAT
jgi:lysophospholipid acyltransferase (LPLAT)-like uncharacterized protein